MSNKSRRRVTMAAGALLAGAAIPIAAAGTAWAQPSPTPPPGCTGVCATDYADAYHAYQSGLPATESYDGKVIFSSGPTDNAVAYTPAGSTGDTALAIGADSDAAIYSGNGDTATAVGDSSTVSDHDTATIYSGTDDTVTAGSSASNPTVATNDTATIVSGSAPGQAADTVSATGTNGDTSTVYSGYGDTASTAGTNDTVFIDGSKDVVSAPGPSYDTVYDYGSGNSYTDTGVGHFVFVP